MNTIEATYRIVTPMFIGGADSSPSDGIRPPSFKGALRFWWRALNWGSYQQKYNNEATALKALHKAECRLFGSAAKDDKGGQGVFLLRTGDLTETRTKNFSPQSGHQYLLGQGLHHFKQGLLRDYLSAGEIAVYLKFKPNADIEELNRDIESIKNALVVLGILGGLGSRSRKGFGSLAIQSMKEDSEVCDIPTSIDDLYNLFNKVEGNVTQDTPPYSAFSNQARIDVSAKSQDALSLLNAIGKEMQMYRGYGRSFNGSHKVNGMKAEQNFANDHHLMASLISGKSVIEHPKRVVFGLPHNYFFSSSKKGVDISASGKQRTRRASPLIIHVHQFPNKKTCIIQTLLPSQFLPALDQVQMKANKKDFLVNAKVDWKTIHDYLNRFESRETIVGGNS